jgi:hypothetical protein
MTLPVANVKIGYTQGGDRATVPITVLPMFIPAGGNPDFPIATDPTGPQFLAILLPTPGEGLPDDPGETARPGGTPGNFLTAQRDRALAEKFRPVSSATSGRREVAITDYSGWYVDTIWILPSPIEFGTIVTSKNVAVSVLNTFREESRTLLTVDISALGAGVSVLADPTPEVLLPQQDLTITLEAVISGPPAINADTVFTFSSIAISVLTTGIRLIIFEFPPDQPIREQLGWFTDVMKARDGIEQRQGLRTTPRTRLSQQWSGPDDAETSRLRTTLLVQRALTYGIPIWTELQRVTQGESAGATVIQVNTDNVDHRVDSIIAIYDPTTRTFEDAEIAAFTSSSITVKAALSKAVPGDAIVLPVRFGHILREPGFDDRRTGKMVTEIIFETEDNVDLAYADLAAVAADGWTVHPEDGYPIFDGCNVMGGTQRRKWEGKITRKDNQIGLPLVAQRYPVSDIVGDKATVDIVGLAEIRRWRSLLHFLRGSLRPFYLPTFRNDLPPDLDFTLNATTITIKNVGLFNLSGFQLPHTSVMLTLPDKSQFFAEIVSVLELSATQEQITLATEFDPAATTVIAATARLSWLELSRMDGDAATFNHKWAGHATLNFNVRTTSE